MNCEFPQSDWKHFKTVRDRALQRLCERALTNLSTVAADLSSTPHERYLEVFRKIKSYDKDIATGFDNLSRSRMLEQIAFARSLNLIEDDEMKNFTQKTQDTVAQFLSL